MAKILNLFYMLALSLAITLSVLIVPSSTEAYVGFCDRPPKTTKLCIEKDKQSSRCSKLDSNCMGK